jgi:hypothetical protein
MRVRSPPRAPRSTHELDAKLRVVQGEEGSSSRSTLEILRKGTNKIWGAGVLVYVLAALVLDFYWLFTETGAVGWLARLQGRWWGVWYPKITLLLVLLVEIAALLAVKIVIEAATGKRLAKPR